MYLLLCTFSILFVELYALFYLYKSISLGRVGWWGMALQYGLWNPSFSVMRRHGTRRKYLCLQICAVAVVSSGVSSCIMFCFNQCEWIHTLGNLTRESGFERWATHEQKVRNRKVKKTLVQKLQNNGISQRIFNTPAARTSRAFAILCESHSLNCKTVMFRSLGYLLHRPHEHPFLPQLFNTVRKSQLELQNGDVPQPQILTTPAARTSSLCTIINTVEKSQLELQNSDVPQP